MKKLITIGLLALGLVSSKAAANYFEQPFLNGWNLWVTNGGTVAVGGTNQMFTASQGQILWSFITNAAWNGTLLSNTPAGDAFLARAVLRADGNGDVNANAAIHYYFNNTNWIPIAVTNAAGQFVVSNNWPLIPPGTPVFMFPATTNVYLQLPGTTTTNALTFNIQGGWDYSWVGFPLVVWDSKTNGFSFTINSSGTIPNAGSTNLPTTFTQQYSLIRLNSVTSGTNSAAGGYIVNMVSLLQPIP